MATTSNQTFDAVEMSRRLREQTSHELESLTAGQRIALLNSHLRRNPGSSVVSYKASEESASARATSRPSLEASMLYHLRMGIGNTRRTLLLSCPAGTLSSI